MSFEMNASWLNLTNQSILNENEERFNFKSTTEGEWKRETNLDGSRCVFVPDFFTREGERFMREDPLLPFSNSILTDITQTQDQSWTHESNANSPGCSTTTFFMAKSSTPDEMLNALLGGKMTVVRNQARHCPSLSRKTRWTAIERESSTDVVSQHHQWLE